MKALRINKFGAPEVLSIEEIPMPEPSKGETLVQVRAAAINPSDVKNVGGFFGNTTLPRTPGRDFSGVIVGGEGKVGEEVWSSVPGSGITRDGSHAEYIVTPAEALSRKPGNVTMEEAAAIGVPFLTAWAAIVRAAQVQEGETVLIVGAGGAVGQAGTQIANWRGAHVIGADLHTGGINSAIAVIDTNQGVLDEQVRALTEGKGVDAVLDTVGGMLFEPSLRSLRPGGRHVAITSVGDPRVSFNLVDFYHNQSRLIGLDSNKFTFQEVAEFADELRSGFEGGFLKPPAIDAVPFVDAITTYKKVAEGRAARKQVLVFL